MSALKELRARLRIVAGPILIALVASYFAYHVVQGEHGLISYLKLRTQVAEARLSLRIEGQKSRGSDQGTCRTYSKRP